MKEIEQTPQKISQEILKVSASKMFTYPTYLNNDAVTPAILEIFRPGYEIVQPEIEYKVTEGVTDSINSRTLQNLSFFKRTLVKKFLKKKFLPPLELDENRVFYDARYLEQNNVAHMLINIMPLALYIAKKNYTNLTLILDEDVRKFILKICELMEIPVINTDREVKGKLISVLNYKGTVYPNKFYQSFLDVYDEVNRDDKKQQIHEKIFIGRKGSRAITNQEEIDSILKEYNFKKVYFEDIPMKEQWLIGRYAKVVIGIHGAAFGALMFNRSQVKVIELFHPGYVINSIRNITNSVGGTWCGVTGKIPEKYSESEIAQDFRKFATSSITISPESLRIALDYMKVEKE